jgi:hypothetical protein
MTRSRASATTRRRFTVEEDRRLYSLVAQYGLRDWVLISSQMLGRDAQQCRHRYHNYLIDKHRYLPWTEHEDRLLIACHREFGPIWVQIAALMPGRTGNDVKNRWHKHILRRAPDAEVTGDSCRDAPSPDNLPEVHGMSEFLQLVLN